MIKFNSCGYCVLHGTIRGEVPSDAGARQGHAAEFERVGRGMARRFSRSILLLITVLCVVAYTLQPAVVESADQGSEPVEMEEITVRATRVEKPLRKVPAAVGVVGQDDIQTAQPQLGLDESLTKIPGLFMQNRFNFAQDLRISIRGFGARAGFGIRGIKIVVDDIPETLADGQGQVDSIDLGSAQRIEVIAPGMLSGTPAAMSGRISVGCKSPLTGGIKESNSGGQAAQVLARLGYAGIVLEGKPADDALYKILINKDGAQVIRDDSLKMLPNYDLIEKMKAEYGDKVACMSIGPAGEMKMGAATVACTDMEFRPTRHAGRGGVGAVMGAKGVKVIIMDDKGLKMRSAKDPEKFKAANKSFVKGLQKHAVTGQALPAYGTNVLTNILNEVGGYPTYNFKQGNFKGATKISGETLAALEKERGGNPTHGCHRGCVIRCSGIFHDKDGHYLTKQPEYETVWAHGGHCGIDDMDKIAQLDFMDDNYGLDTIELGAAIGVAMDAGVIEFGDADGAIRLVEEVGKGTHLGRILGNGAGVTGKAFGVERVPVVKNQAMPAYDPRAVQGIGVTYATTTMGADHTAGYAVAQNVMKVGGDVDALKPEGQVALSRDLQIATAAIDSTGMCLFIAFAILDQPDTFQALLDMIGAFHGTEMTGDGVTELGKKVLSMERDFNARAGFTKAHDRLPRYFQTEAFAPHNVTFDVTDEDLDSVFNW